MATRRETEAIRLYANLMEDVKVYLFPLGGLVYFAAHMRNPDRTSFVVKRDGRLVEVLSMNGAGVLRDAMVIGARVALLYDREMRILNWDLSNRVQ